MENDRKFVYYRVVIWYAIVPAPHDVERSQISSGKCHGSK